MSNQVYGYVTDKIIGELSKGIIPWRKTWAGIGLPANFVSGKEYRGVNVWLLALQPKPSNYWLTFNQVKELGGSIQKGAKSSMVVFYKSLEVERENQNGDIKADTIPFLRYYRVFNAGDIQGIEFPEIEKRNNPPIDSCRAIVENYPAPSPAIENSGFHPCYIPPTDKVEVPPPDYFENSAAYYATLFHELVHSTGHKNRLDRGKGNQFGSPEYAREELVAELGAAFLCWSAGISNDSLIKNEAAYIQNWLTALKNDKTLIVKAAAKAQAAADYILNKVQAPAAVVAA